MKYNTTISLLYTLLLLLLLSFWLHVEIWDGDILRPGAGLAGTQDSMAQIQDFPGKSGRGCSPNYILLVHCGSKKTNDIFLS